MKTFTSTKPKQIILIIATVLFSVNSYGQFYEWAFAPSFVTHGAYGSFQSTDMHGNAYYFGVESPCWTCQFPVIQSISPDGLVNWNLAFGGGVPPLLYAVDADSSNNRYVLMELTSLPYPLGNFIINDPFCIVKYNSAGNPVRVTVLPEKYTQIKTDSVGNTFVSTGTTVRRYNKFGLFSWEYAAGFVHTLYLDNFKNNYLVNDTIAVKLNPSGAFKYSIVETGDKTIDSKGRLYVNTPGGLKRYDKNGIFQWIRPGISGEIQVNSNGNIYAFRNDSLIKYNQAGTIIQWVFENIPSPGVVNLFGDIYFGGTYNPFTTDLQLCPFRMPSLGSMAQMDPTQVWLAKLNGKDPIPFQAAVYTKLVKSQNLWSEINSLCTSSGIIGSGTPLFESCTNAASSFDPGNEFTIEISNSTGNFTNAINIGSTATGVIPDSIPYGIGYRVRVVSSTPGVSYYPNLPYVFNSDVTIHPNRADLSLSGVQNICEGTTIQLSVAVSDTNGSIYWYDSGNSIPGSENMNSITIDSSGYYFAHVTNNACYHETDTVVVNVNPRPNPVILPTGPISFCDGDSVILCVSDIDLNTIKWRLNGINIQGYHDTTLTVYTAGNYSSRITNVFGCARTSAPVSVAVPCREGQFYSEENTISIYPNPVSNNQMVYIQGFVSIQKIEIFNSMGQLVHLYTDWPEQEGIRLNLPPGIYTVSISNDTLSARRVIVVVE